MKKIFCIAASAIFLISCNKKSENYHIIGTIDFPDAKQIFIEIPGESRANIITIDTAVVNNGSFEFKGKAEEITMAYLSIAGMNAKIPFILENEKMNVVIYKDSMQASKVTGSYNNDEFINFNKKYKEEQGKVYRKMQEFEEQNRDKMMEARNSNNQAVIEELTNQHRAFRNEIFSYMLEYVSNNPKSYVSVLLLSDMVNNPEIDFQKLQSGFESLNKNLKATKLAKQVEERLKTISATAIGGIAPDFSAPNPEGKMISLKESLGKVTIIDFWASWCRPCRIENPNVVALYNEYHDKGLNIIGVSLDREHQKQQWIEAIATDKLTWPQVSNLVGRQAQDPIAELYGVNSIPATFVLDRQGKIVAKNLRGEQLRAKVEELLK